MIYRSSFGHPMAGVSMLFTVAQLKALSVGDHVPGEEFTLTDGRVFYYNSTSVLAGDDIFVIAPTTGAGRYLLCPGFVADIPIAISFANTDAQVLATLPAGMVFLGGRSYWEITADWTGGTSSAIGLSSGQAPHNTKGDLLGGGSGDVAATLVASGGKLLGTIGADVAAGVLLKPAATIRFDRITSAFTAGTGFAHLVGTVLANPGA
jgi:hypothetical protein